MREPAIVPFKRPGEMELRLHVFRPDDAPGPRPAILFFLCGGWRGFHPPKFYPHADYLAGRGMIGISAEARALGHGAESPVDCVIDARSAVRWTRAHVADLGIDPDRIAAGGGSASGHVAACTTLLDGPDGPGEDTSVSPAADALVLFNPALDIPAKPSRIELFGDEETARAFSPIEHVRPGLPPAIVLHGRDDQVVRLGEAVRFTEAMQSAGNRCDLHVYDGEGHGFFNYFDGDNPMFTETIRETDRFLASLGWLAGEPTIDEYEYDGPPTTADQG
ncbi:MAG: alpha/beta hydrolase [Planctomycetota bacterium]